MPKLTVLVGPPASGKSTLAKDRIQNGNDHGAATVYVNQDSQGKGGHVKIFQDAIALGKDVVIDRLNFNKEQRNRYLSVAKAKGYKTEIIVLHESYKTCLERGRARFGQHETIHEEKHIRGALQTFFGKYERPTPDEADKIQFVYPEGEKPTVVYSDLDGTLCDVEHRRHHVRRTDGKKKDWNAFFKDICKDTVNKPVLDILQRFSPDFPIVFCTGRSTNEQKPTVEWLNKHVNFPYTLYMRDRQDSRQDSTVKEVILDFELLTRYQIYFCLDDRDQVVKMLRNRGLTVFQVAEGDF